MRLRLVGAATATVAVAGCSGHLAAPATVYFLVSELTPKHHDSYVLPLTDAAAIAHARALIRDPGGTPSKIVVAQIDRGSGDGTHVNRDLLSGGRAWSWHVTRFVGFADMTIEILDGWPGYVETNLDEWIRITHGQIGFWTYTVTREVPYEEVRP